MLEPKNKAPATVGGMRAGKVNNDNFLVQVPYASHTSWLTTNFPVENRLLQQGA
jgi:hypothetical protein